MKHTEVTNVSMLYEMRDETITKKDVAFRDICKESLSRILSAAQKHDFAILTAYRKGNSKEENVTRNRQLRGELNTLHLGVHPLVGHWRECQVPDMPYDQCPANMMSDVIERSYFVFRNENIDQTKFKDIITRLGKKYGQDAVILKLDDDVKVVLLNSDEEIEIGKGVSLGKIAQGYSQYVRKLKVPFVFEGLERPTATSQANSVFYKDGFRWS